MKTVTPDDVSKLQIAAWSRFHISYLEDHLVLREVLPVYTLDVARRFADGNVDALKSVAAMLQRVDRTNGDLPTLYAASNALRREAAPPSQGPGKGRAAIYSVPLADVPEQDRALIKSWKGAEKTRTNMLYVLRQVYGAARRAGLPEVFGKPALAALRTELDDRGRKPGAIEQVMRDCLRLGSLFGIEDWLSDLIRAEMNAAKRDAKSRPSNRKADFRAYPVSPIDYARRAREVARRAHSCTAGRQTRHRLFLTAGILAFLSWMPDRVGDILKLIVGRDVIRTNKYWQLNTAATKNGFDLTFPVLPDALTPYLDDLVLLGADPGLNRGCWMSSTGNEWLWRARSSQECLLKSLTVRFEFSSG